MDITQPGVHIVQGVELVVGEVEMGHGREVL